MDFILVLLGLVACAIILVKIGNRDDLLELFSPILLLAFGVLVILGAGILFRFIAHV